MKTARKMLSLLLVLGMLISAAACSGNNGGSSSSAASSAPAKTEAPAWLNTDGYHPIVKDGSEQKLSFTIFVGDDYSADPMQRYYWTMMKEVLGITPTVDQVLSSAADETVTLQFASDTLKDITLRKTLSGVQQVLYGMTEKQIWAIDEILDPVITPQLYSIFFEQYPEAYTGLQLPDGHIYAYPYITEPYYPSGYAHLQLRETWMNELNITNPTNLDDFTKMLYAFKKAHPESIPLGGGYTASNPCAPILHALGVVTTDGKGLSAGVRNGAITIPGGDKEVWTAFLTLMHEYYENGLIDPDFFTLEQAQLAAQASEGKIGATGANPFIIAPDYAMYSQYVCQMPMTSALNDKAFSVRSCFYSNGGAFVSAKCENKVLAARWADWMCTNEGTNCAWVGANKDNKEIMLDGWGGWYMNDNGSRVDVERVDVEGGTDKWPNAVVYLRSKVAGFDMGALGYTVNEIGYRLQQSGKPTMTYYEQYKASPDNGDFYWRVSAMDNLDPARVFALPNTVFFSGATNDRVIELETPIKDYIEKESAKFITGENDLSKLDAYFDELNNKYNFQEYLKYYQEGYATALKAFNN